MILDTLRQAPFSLGDDRIAQVEATLAGLDLPSRVAQLFTLLLLGDDPADLEAVLRFRPGGITRFFGPDPAHEREVMSRIEAALSIAPLVSADLEGSRQSFAFGTTVPNQLGTAAIDDPETAERLAGILAREGRAMGVRWSFTPVIDINAAFRSAVVGTRSYGSDLARIEAQMRAHVRGMQDNGVAATVKHWPGEGYDDRDQHLVTTTNPLSPDEWHARFGRLYRTAFDDGVMAVMAAHIAAPALARAMRPDIGRDAFMPASISRLLTHDLLRGELGFNGVVVSDATEMAGLGSWIGEPQAMPALLAAGCDMILFSRDPERDRDAILEAVAAGHLSRGRIDEAVTRVLGLKAALGLLDGEPLLPPADRQRAILGDPASRTAAAAAFARMPTLEKDVDALLPLDVDRHRRILLFEGPIRHPLLPEPPSFVLPDLLRKEGFAVTRHERGLAAGAEEFDLVLYLLGDESLFTRSRIFIDWTQMGGGGIGGALKRYWQDIPTLMISFGHPYHLYDAPRVPAYANGWSTVDAAQTAMLECLMGRAPWRGGHPVDAFCGLEDARF